MSNQELITPELAKKIQEYELTMQRWRSAKVTQRRGALYAILIAAPMWIVSYLASSETGPINQATWFTGLTFFAFVAALGASAAAVLLGGFVVIHAKPVRNFVMESEIPT